MSDTSKPWFQDPRLHHRVTDLFAGLPAGVSAPPQPPQQDPRSPNVAESVAYWTANDQMMRHMIPMLYGSQIVDDKATVRQLSIPSFDGTQIPARLYEARRPAGSPPPPLVVHFHGGGMTTTSYDMPYEVNACHRIAVAGVSVLSVEFRNASTDPFPTGVDDCLAACVWARENAHMLGVGDTLVTFGVSGGGNLSIATCLRAHQRGHKGLIDGILSHAPFILGQYPTAGAEAHRANDGYLMTLQDLQNLVNNYTTSAADYDNPAAWPMKASDAELAALPPTLLVVDECDLLRGDGEAFFARLRRLRVPGCSMIMRYGELHCQGYSQLIEDTVAATHAEHLAGFVRVIARSKQRAKQPRP